MTPALSPLCLPLHNYALLPQLLHPVYAPELRDQLVLSFNNTQPDAVHHLLKHLLYLQGHPTQLAACLQQLDQAVVQQLLSTALLRRHFAAITYLDTLLERFKPECSCPNSITTHLIAAVQRRDSEAVSCLCKLRVSRRIDPAAVPSMLLQAMRQDHYRAIDSLTKLPPASRLPVDSIAELIRTAMHLMIDEDVVAFLCEQDAAQHIGPADITELLLVAVRMDRLGSLEMLLELQPAQLLDAPAAAALLQMAIGTAAAAAPYHSSAAAVEVICDMAPAALELDTAAVSALLSSAVATRECSSASLWALLGLPSGPGISSSCIAGLLETALQHDNAAAVKELCLLPAACNISVSKLRQLLSCAARHKVLRHVAAPLVALQPDGIDWWVFTDVIRAAAWSGDADGIEALAGLSMLPGTSRQIAGSYLVQLLQDACGRPEIDLKMLVALCKLDVRGTVPSGIAAPLVQSVLKAGDSDMLAVLASSKVGAVVDACSMESMLWWAMEHCDSEAFGVLSKMPQAVACIAECSALQRAVECVRMHLGW